MRRGQKGKEDIPRSSWGWGISVGAAEEVDVVTAVVAAVRSSDGDIADVIGELIDLDLVLDV